MDEVQLAGPDRLRLLDLADNKSRPSSARRAAFGKSLAPLAKLDVLFLDGNGLKALPPEIGRLTNLRTLGLNRNKLAHIPSSCGSWAPPTSLEAQPADEIAAVGPKNVHELDVGGNLIRSLPGPELAKLVNLTWLRLTHNLLPCEGGALVNLRELRLSGNGLQLRALPPELGRLPRLEVLHLYPNELLRLPPGCREGDPPEALLECLRSLAASPQSSSGPFGSRLPKFWYRASSAARGRWSSPRGASALPMSEY
eukprot:tig00000343_g24273.t1